MSIRLALGVFVVFSLARALLLPAFDLMPQSAYYSTAYGEHPALSYYDHPPMIGWLLWLGTGLLGATTFGVRATVFLATLGTQLAFFALARRFLEPAAAGRALVLLTTGGVAVLMSFVAVPDVPLLLFWALALLGLETAVFRRRAGAGAGSGTAVWAVAGVAMGLAFLGKYTGVFLQGGLLLFLLASREHRPLLRTPGPWLSLALAQLVSLPVYAWNARHGWASFVYQGAGRAAEGRPFDPDFVLGFLGSQAVVLLPVAFFALLWVAGREGWRALRRAGPPEPTAAGERTLFLLCFTVPVLATCLLLSPVTWVKTNWALPAYLSGLILAAGAIGRRATRWHLATGVVLHAALAVQVLWYPVPVKSHDTWFGWRELGREVEALARRHPEAFLFAADGYKTTAELRFYTGLPVHAMDVLGWDALQYGFEDHDLEALAGRDALYLRNEPELRPGEETECFLERVRGHFRRVVELPPIEVRRRGEVVRLVRVFRCEGYLGPAPPGVEALPDVC